MHLIRKTKRHLQSTATNSGTLSSFIDSVPSFDPFLARPTVDEANRSSAAFARVFKEFILVTHPVKPLPKTLKGSVIRKQAYELYETEIEGIYKAANYNNAAVPPKSWGMEDLKVWLLDGAKELVGVDIKDGVDLFEQGADRYNRFRVTLVYLLTRALVCP